MAQRKCLVRGSINVDEYFGVTRIAQPGETISSRTYTRGPGGKGANGAVAIAKAGGPVDFAGLIGEDALWLRETMSRYGVGVNELQVSVELPTGRAFIQVGDDGENAIVLLKGANHPPFFALPSLSSYSHLLVQNEIPLGHTVEALQEARSAGVMTIWNPSPVPDMQDADIWTCVDWLIVNEGEASSILRETVRSSVIDVRPSDIVERLLETTTVQHGVVVTRGSKGAVVALRTSEGVQRLESSSSGLRGPVIDTTGAGDCFTGYFVANLLRLGDCPSPAEVAEATSIACFAASMSVGKHGTMDSVPSLDEVRERWISSDREWPMWGEDSRSL